MAQGTLSGLHVALTRERQANSVLASLLQARGVVTHDCPLLRILPPADVDPLENCLSRLATYDWLVLTSTNAAFAVLSRAALPPGLQVACVGETTASQVREAGFDVNLLPARQTSKGLLEALASAGMKGKRVLWPRSELAPDTLMRGLQALGATVEDPVGYRNEPDAPGLAELERLLQAREVQVVAFASASAARYAVRAVGELLHTARLYTIGASTTRELAGAGFSVAGEAADHSAQGLAQVVLDGESGRS